MVSIAHRLLNFQEAIKAARTIKDNTEDEIRQALQGVDVVGGYSGDAGCRGQDVEPQQLLTSTRTFHVRGLNTKPR